MHKLETADLVFVKFFERRAASISPAACCMVKMVSSCEISDAALTEARKRARQNANERDLLLRVFRVDPKFKEIIIF